MPIVFDDGRKDVRKFCCFVCGVLFDDYPEYAEHIIEKHELSKDYVLCPMEHCKAPVRDIRAHFKAKHPYAQPPKKGLMKAIVWRDFKIKGGKKKQNFKTGYHTSTKMRREFYYRSGWEEEVYKILDKWDEVVGYEAEPFDIPYVHEATQHMYKPDIFVSFVDGHKAIYEVKPTNQTNLQINKDKWLAATKICETRGWEFVIVTEQFIEKLKRKVMNQN